MLVDTPVKELLLFDADGGYSQRVKINSVTPHSPTSVDPYDDVNKPTEQFHYSSIKAVMPFSARSTTLQPLDWTFITGSSAYPLQTQYLCIGASGNLKGKLLRYVEGTRPNDPWTAEVIFDPTSYKTTISRFQVNVFYGSRDLGVQNAVFQAFPKVGGSITLADAQKNSQCTYALQIYVEFTSTVDSNVTKRDRVVLLNDAQKRLPKLCY